MTTPSWYPAKAELALAAALAAFAVCAVVTPLVRRVAVRRGLVARSSGSRWKQQRVVARLGGIGIMLGCLAGLLVNPAGWQPLAGVIVGAALVFTLGLVDDIIRLRPYTKLVCQLIISCLVVASGVRVELISWSWLALPASVIWLVFGMNAFNLLDNMDGLAAGVGALAAAFCAAHATVTGNTEIVVMAAALAGATLAFLRYNFPPAKIFMGDSGSQVIGIILASLALSSTWRHSTQLVTILAIPLLILSVPIFDTVFVTVQRLTHQRHPMHGGTDHISHRLAILGLSERQAVLILYGVSACYGLLGLLYFVMKPWTTLVTLLLGIAAFLVLGAYLSRVKVYEVQRGPTVAPRSTQRPVLIETMLLHKRRVLEVLVDFLLICSAYVAAHLLRYEGFLTADVQALMLRSLPLVVIIKLAALSLFGLYRGLWRYVSLADMVAIWKGVTTGSALSALALLAVWRFEGFSRSVFVMDWCLLFLGICGTRVVERLLNEWVVASRSKGRRILIVGAGDLGASTLRELQQLYRDTYQPMGFIDDDPRKVGQAICGIPVLGTRHELATTVQQWEIEEVHIAISRLPQEVMDEIKQVCSQLEVRVICVPMRPQQPSWVP